MERACVFTRSVAPRRVMLLNIPNLKSSQGSPSAFPMTGFGQVTKDISASQYQKCTRCRKLLPFPEHAACGYAPGAVILGPGHTDLTMAQSKSERDTETVRHSPPTTKELLRRKGAVCEVELTMESCFREKAAHQCPALAFWSGERATSVMCWECHSVLS